MPVGFYELTNKNQNTDRTIIEKQNDIQRNTTLVIESEISIACNEFFLIEVQL